MSAPLRLGITLALVLASAAPARAGVQILMTADGEKGLFATQDLGVPDAMRVASVGLDFPSIGTSVPKPVVVTRAIDRISGQFMKALASNELLKVVITIVQTPAEGGMPLRRIITLSNARIMTIHDGMDAKGAPPEGLGFETIAFAYENIEVEDDGVKVFSSGG